MTIYVEKIHHAETKEFESVLRSVKKGSDNVNSNLRSWCRITYQINILGTSILNKRSIFAMIKRSTRLTIYELFLMSLE